MTQFSCDLAEWIQWSKYCYWFLITNFSLNICQSIFSCRQYIYCICVYTVKTPLLVKYLFKKALQDNSHTYILVQAQFDLAFYNPNLLFQFARGLRLEVRLVFLCHNISKTAVELLFFFFTVSPCISFH